MHSFPGSAHIFTRFNRARLSIFCAFALRTQVACLALQHFTEWAAFSSTNRTGYKFDVTVCSTGNATGADIPRDTPAAEGAATAASRGDAGAVGNADSAAEVRSEASRAEGASADEAPNKGGGKRKAPGASKEALPKGGHVILPYMRRRKGFAARVDFDGCEAFRAKEGDGASAGDRRRSEGGGGDGSGGGGGGDSVGGGEEVVGAMAAELGLGWEKSEGADY